VFSDYRKVPGLGKPSQFFAGNRAHASRPALAPIRRPQPGTFYRDFAPATSYKRYARIAERIRQVESELLNYLAVVNNDLERRLAKQVQSGVQVAGAGRDRRPLRSRRFRTWTSWLIVSCFSLLGAGGLIKWTRESQRNRPGSSAPFANQLFEDAHFA
jgi:hypothetical protein